MDKIKIKDINLLLLIMFPFTFLYVIPMSHIFMFIIIQVWAGKYDLRLRDFLHFEKVKLSVLLLSVLIAVLMKLEFFLLFFKFSIQTVREYSSSLSLSVWLMFLAVILAPFVEELLCRGVLYNFYKKKGILLSLILSSIFFSLFHFNLNGLMGRFIIGVILALLYEITQCFWVPVLVHSSYNALTALFVFEQIIEPLQALIYWLKSDNTWFSAIKFWLISAVLWILIILILLLITRISGNKIFDGQKLKNISVIRNDEPIIDIPLIVVFILSVGMIVGRIVIS